MKIEMNKPASRGFAEEAVYIRTNYVRVQGNPGRPAKTVTNFMAIRIIGFFIVALVALYLALSTQDMIYMAITGAMAIAVVAIFLSYRGTRKAVYEFMEDDSPKTLELTEDHVSFTGGEETLRYSWEDIDCVAVNKRSITFFPKKVALKPIFADVEYKDQILNGLKEAEHGYLIEDNVTVER